MVSGRGGQIPAPLQLTISTSWAGSHTETWRLVVRDADQNVGFEVRGFQRKVWGFLVLDSVSKVSKRLVLRVRIYNMVTTGFFS